MSECSTFDVIRSLVAGAQISVSGNPQNESEYAAQVQWLDDRPQPSWAEVQAHRPTAETEVANETAKQARATAYRFEADPLFFGWQRGENTEQEWLDKVAEIRARHPYA